jgi:hypothetical protein
MRCSRVYLQTGGGCVMHARRLILPAAAGATALYPKMID